MKGPAFTKDGHPRGFCFENRLEIGIILHGNTTPAGAAKSHQLGMIKTDALDAIEKFDVFGVGTGVSGFNVINPHFIEGFDHADFIFDREGYSFGLGPISEG